MVGLFFYATLTLKTCIWLDHLICYLICRIPRYTFFSAVCACVRVCAYVRACVRVCVGACVRALAHACVCVCPVKLYDCNIFSSVYTKYSHYV